MKIPASFSWIILSLSAFLAIKNDIDLLKFQLLWAILFCSVVQYRLISLIIVHCISSLLKRLNEMLDKKGLLTMPEIFNGIEYLNAKESAAYLNKMSYVTFQKIRDRVNPRTGKPNLQSHEIIGKGRTRYYKLEDLKNFKEELVRPLE